MRKMTEAETKLIQEQFQLQHAMQSGVKHEHNLGSDDGSPKHLRVGVNSALCFHAALCKVLMDKGVCTMEEILQAENELLREEVARYEMRNEPIKFW
jgi:hypothetical protein